MTYTIPPKHCHFTYVPGTSGVDSTFDIYCVETGKQIASIGYWDAKESAESIAYSITYALNRHYRPLRSRLRKTDHRLVHRFLAENPSPFSVSTVREPEYDIVGIVSDLHAQFILYEELSDVTPEVTVFYEWLNRILNNAFSSHACQPEQFD